ncbi:MAG: trehalose-6-phosphate synthase, partial [Rhodoferax sp.]
MSRLVVVSNRVADPRKAAAGGLAVALGDALNTMGGLWFGWSGTVLADGTQGEGALHQQKAGNVTLATVDLCAEDHAGYYLGYSNGVLWPVFHYRLDLARFDAGYFGAYRRVNRLFARQLLPLLRHDDILWVHDYHLI